MAQQDYQVRLTAETKAAEEKLDAVQNKLNLLTDNPKQIKIDASTTVNAFKQTVKDTETIANNIRTTQNLAGAIGGIALVTPQSIQGAAKLYQQFSGARKEIRGIQEDLVKAVKKTNVSEFMRSDKFLDRIAKEGKSRTGDYVDIYKNFRKVPGVEDILGPAENFARAKAWETYGKNIADSTFGAMQTRFQQAQQGAKNFLYGDLFQEMAVGANNAVTTLARVGLALQGVQLLVGPLAAAWGAAFNQIIGQNVKLEQTILSTQTTLASTGRVVDKSSGEEITDPLQKILALEGDVRNAVENIRVRSLEIAGVTSAQIIDIFGVVATSIGQVGGDIKDAEDMAISFTAALGTLGIPFYQARQEIGSILGGYITEDSLLAKRLQISNADIQKARQSVDGVVGYLQKKLQTAVAGQAISAKGFAGVLSNIQEVFEVAAQRIGAPLLEPLVAGLTVVYETLKKISGVVIEVGAYLTNTLVKAVTSITTVIGKTNLAKNFSKGLNNLAKPYEDLQRAVKLGLQTNNKNLVEGWVESLDGVPPALQAVVNGLVSIGNFLRTQVELITQPIFELLDASRERLSGFAGAIQAAARAPQLVFLEGGDAFTKGWDTVQSTIQLATQGIVKLGAAIVKLEITKLTAQIRAASVVFELFGSLLLGRINLALAVFDGIGNIVGSEFAQITVAFLSVNKLLNNTEFFGLKGIIVQLTAGSGLIKRTFQDIGLFLKGFKDAGNIENYFKKAGEAAQSVLNIRQKTPNDIVKNMARIDELKAKLEGLRQVQAAGIRSTLILDNAADMARYKKEIGLTISEIKRLREENAKFTKLQRVTGLVQSVVGGGPEMAAAKQAAREAQVVATGAASAQVVSQALETLRVRLGLSKEEFNSFGGAAKVAGKSLMQFLTTSMLVNIGFAALSLGIAGYLTYLQKQQEAEKKLIDQKRGQAAVNHILATSYTSLIKAAEGGDVMSQNKLSAATEELESYFQTQKQKYQELTTEGKKYNNVLYEQRKAVKNMAQNMRSSDFGTAVIANVNFGEFLVQQKILDELEKGNLKTSKEREKVLKEMLRTQTAINKIKAEEDQAKSYEIVSERRKDLEEKIKTMREDFEKELSDKGFQARMEVLSLEQQKRREIQQQEMNALKERFALTLNNSSEQDKKLIQLAQDYQVALVEAANSEGNRRAELQQKQDQLRKEIEDYAFKLARERINIEKQIGAYKKQVADYEDKRSKLRMQQELADTRRIQALKGVNFEPVLEEQRQGYLNSVNQIGFDQLGLTHRDVYAILQTIPKEMLGVSGEENISVILQKLYLELNKLRAQGSKIDPVSIAEQFYQTSKGNAQSVVDNLRSEADQRIQGQRFFVRQDPNALQAPNLNIDYAGMEARVAQFNQSVVQAFKDLQAATAAGDQANIKTALDRFKDPSLLTDVKASNVIEPAMSRFNLDAALRSIQNFGQGLDRTAEEMLAINTRYNAGIRVLLTQAGLSGAELENVAQQIAAADSQLIEGKAPEELTKLFAKLNIGSQIRNYAQGRQAALTQAERGVPTLERMDVESQVTKFINALEAQVVESRIEKVQSSLSNLTEALQAGADQTYSLKKAEAAASLQVSNFVQSELLKLKGNVTDDDLNKIAQAASILEGQLIRQAKILDPFNTLLEKYKTNLSNALEGATTVTEGYKGFLKSIIMGGDVTDALNNMLNSIADKFLQMGLDFAFKPVQKAFEDMFKQGLGVQDMETQLKQENNKAISALSQQVTNNLVPTIQSQLVPALDGVTAALQNFRPATGEVKPIPETVFPTTATSAMAPGTGSVAQTPNAQALLDTIRFAEGTWAGGSDEGYRTMFGGGKFNDMSRHPDRVNRSGGYASAAAGAYQYMPPTWEMVQKALGTKDFGKTAQDQGALYLAQRRGVDPNQNISRQMIAKLAPEWASFPTMQGGSAYGQPSKSYSELERFYNQRLAALQGASAAKPMPVQVVNPPAEASLAGTLTEPTPSTLVAPPTAPAPPTLPAPIELPVLPAGTPTSPVSVSVVNGALPAQAPTTGALPQAAPALPSITGALDFSTFFPAFDPTLFTTFETGMADAAANLTTWTTGLTTAQTGLGDLGLSTNALSQTLNTTTGAAQQAPGFFSRLGPAIQGATGALASVAVGIAGAQQMSKGGTYNTLMGLAGIFSGIAGVAGAFSPTGGLGGLFRAKGGPVSANRPYIVGEQGPELFMPNSDGEIVPNNRMGDAFEDTRRTLGESRKRQRNASERTAMDQMTQPQGPISVAYESRVINSVEYVTTEQMQKATAQAAERGRALAYQGMQNSVRVRRRLSL